MNIKIRKLMIVMIGLLMMVSLIGCGAQNFTKNSSNIKMSTDDQDEREPLNFRITWKSYSGRGEAIKKIVNAYNETNESPYQVTVMDGDEDLNTIETLLKEGEAVDVYVLPYRYVSYLGYKDQIEVLTNDFNDEKSFFYEKLWELGVVNQKVYGIPWLGHSMGLIYNKTLLDQAEVNPDNINNLEDLISACQKVETNTEAKGIGLVGANHNDVSWMVNQFIYGFGGSLINSEGTAVTINSEQSKRAIDFYKNRLGQYAQETWKTDTGVEVMDYFRNQQIAFEIQGLWGITDIWKNGKTFETGVIPLEKIGLYPEVGPMLLALQPNMNEDKKAASVDFMKFLISTEAQELILAGEYNPEQDAYYPFRLPVRKDITESLVFEKYPEFALFINGFSKPSIDVPVPLWQHIKDDYYAPGLHSVMEDEITIDAFLKEIEEKGNQILRGGSGE